MAATELLERVRNLVKLAADDEASPEEARTAAFQAARLMSENDLTIVPKKELDQVVEKIDGMREELAQGRKRERVNMFMAAVGGWLASDYLGHRKRRA